MLHARLTIRPPSGAPVINVAGLYGPRGQMQCQTVSVFPGFYSASLDCDGGLGFGRIYPVPGRFASEAEARQSAIAFAARRLGRAVIAASLVLAAWTIAPSQAGADETDNLLAGFSSPTGKARVVVDNLPIRCTSGQHCAETAELFGCRPAKKAGKNGRKLVCDAETFRFQVSRHSA